MVQFHIIREDFPILSQRMGEKPLIYLDSAATTQKPRQVIEEIVNYYSKYNSNVGRGMYDLSIKTNALFWKARVAVKRYINAMNENEVIFTSGTTESINMVAVSFVESCLRPGAEILVSEMEHHSNLCPWIMAAKKKDATVKYINVDDNGCIDLEQYRSLFNSKTQFVAITQISNTFGSMTPLKEMIAFAHTHNVPVLVDGAQGAGHCPVDVQNLDCDFYCFSGHKMYAPTGIGVLYGKEKYLKNMTPYRTGGGMVTEVFYNQHIDFKQPPDVFEAGTPNIEGVIGLFAAIKYIKKIEPAEIAMHEKTLSDQLYAGLMRIGNMRIMGNGKNRTSIVSFTVNGIHPYDVASHLNHYGISVRSGFHCAMPILEKMKFTVGTVRASFGVYNSSEEVDYFLNVMSSVQPGEWTKNKPTEKW